MPRTIKAMCTGCNTKLSIYVHKGFNNTNLLLNAKYGVDYLIQDRELENGNTTKACDLHGIIKVKDIKSIKEVKDKQAKDWNKSDKNGKPYDTSIDANMKDAWDTVEADLDDKFEDPFHTPDLE